GPRRHAEAVAEQGAAAERTLRVARQHRDALPGGADLLDELAGERALADAAAAGDRHDARRLRRRAGAREDRLGLLAARDEADEARQGAAVALVEALEQVVKHGPPRCSVAKRRRYPAAACPARRRARRPSPSISGCQSRG